MRVQSDFFSPLASYSRTLYASKRLVVGRLRAGGGGLLAHGYFLVGSADCASPGVRGGEAGAAPKQEPVATSAGRNTVEQGLPLAPQHAAEPSLAEGKPRPSRESVDQPSSAKCTPGRFGFRIRRRRRPRWIDNNAAEAGHPNGDNSPRFGGLLLQGVSSLAPSPYRSPQRWHNTAVSVYRFARRHRVRQPRTPTSERGASTKPARCLGADQATSAFRLRGGFGMPAERRHQGWSQPWRLGTQAFS